MHHKLDGERSPWSLLRRSVFRRDAILSAAFSRDFLVISNFNDIANKSSLSESVQRLSRPETLESGREEKVGGKGRGG